MLDMVLPRPAAYSMAGSPGEAALPARRQGYSFLLLLRFALINIVAGALAIVAWLHGWVNVLNDSDPTKLWMVTTGLFVAGLVLCGMRVWKVSLELNEVAAPVPHPGSKVAKYLALVHDAGPEDRSIAADSLKLQFTSRIVAVRQIASTLVILGLLGTVIGFIISLGSVSPEAATDAKAVTPMIAQLISGMSVALGNTLIGGILNLWLIANYHILATGTARLIGAILERGITHVAR